MNGWGKKNQEKRKWFCEKKGQTILEFLVALTLITLFLSGIVVLQLISIRNAQFSRNKSLATKYANEQLERVRVVRDSTGMSSLAMCMSGCFINSQLTPLPITPTGPFGQWVVIQTASALECPPPNVSGAPTPAVYRAQSRVEWSQGDATITPAQEVSLETCLVDPQ